MTKDIRKNRLQFIEAIANGKKDLLEDQIRFLRGNFAPEEIHEFLNESFGAEEGETPFIESCFQFALREANFRNCVLLAANGAKLDPDGKSGKDNLCYIEALKRFEPINVMAIILRERLYDQQLFERSSHRFIVPGEMTFKRFETSEEESEVTKVKITSPKENADEDEKFKKLRLMTKIIGSQLLEGPQGIPEIGEEYQDLLARITADKAEITSGKATKFTATKVSTLQQAAGATH